MKAKVTWNEKLAFTGTADSGFTIPLDAKEESGGMGTGFMPMELMAMSLAGCTSMDVISIMSKKRQDVTDFEVHVDADRAEEHPKVFTKAVIEYIFIGKGIDEKAVRRSIELSAERYCPAQGMLGKLIPIDLKYKIYEDEGDGQRSLVVEGEYQPEKV